MGRADDDHVNSVLVAGLAQRAMALTVRFAVPVFLTAVTSDALAPTLTLPKLSVPGLRAMPGADGAATVKAGTATAW
jgi:hypothetical protein